MKEALFDQLIYNLSETQGELQSKERGGEK